MFIYVLRGVTGYLKGLEVIEMVKVHLRILVSSVLCVCLLCGV